MTKGFMMNNFNSQNVPTNINGESDLPDILKQEDYYNNYWKNRSRTLNSHEALRLAEIIQPMSGIIEDARRRKADLNICDFGSGWGWLSNILSNFGKVTGVELSNQAVVKAQKDFPHIKFVCADITDWKPTGRKFDLIVSSEVLEHVPNKEKYFETLDEILTPGGHVIITTPNKRVQKSWDKANLKGQIIEDWCSTSELKNMIGNYQVHLHKTFLFDFCYTGPFRILSAPKLLATLRVIGLLDFYNYIRRILGLGLYQIIHAQKQNDPMDKNH